MRKTRGKTTVHTIQAARDQRRAPTRAEQILWEALRGRRLAGLKFRRQHPYDRFVLDAFCVEHQLEVEVDGGIHADAARIAHDAARAEFLQQHGIRILRFANEEVEERLAEVLRRIVEATSSPGPSPPTARDAVAVSCNQTDGFRRRGEESAATPPSANASVSRHEKGRGVVSYSPLS